MKKYLSLFLIICLFVPFAGNYFWLQLEKYRIKKQVKWRLLHELTEENLILLKLTIQESQTRLRWEHAEEFEFQGEMYDVISQQKQGDSIFYRCWKDTEETEIKQKIGQLVAQALNQNPQHRKNQDQLRFWMESLWCMQVFQWLQSPFQDFIFEHIFFYSKPYFYWVRSSLSPPPE